MNQSASYSLDDYQCLESRKLPKSKNFYDYYYFYFGFVKQLMYEFEIGSMYIGVPWFYL